MPSEPVYNKAIEFPMPDSDYSSHQTAATRFGTLISALKHLLCFVFPLTTFTFLLTGVLIHQPHTIAANIAWTIPFWLVLWQDWRCSKERQPANSRHPGWFFDTILYVLVLLQLANIVLMLEYLALLRWNDATAVLTSIGNLIGLRFLVGTSSGTSGIVVAHELIHRPERHWQALGRLLLCTVLYEHFVITHRRGHHLNLGMPDDIATARFGESFKAYWRRICPGYWRYAWRSERERLHERHAISRIISNEIMLGAAIEFILIMLIFNYYGWLTAIMFLLQALAAARILEAVNYFQHWGLEDGRFGNSFGWVCPSWISRYTLIGLSHHIGHHLDEDKPFHDIAYSEDGPRLPYGYFAMNLWVKLDNDSYMRMAERELNKYRTHQSNIRQS